MRKANIKEKKQALITYLYDGIAYKQSSATGTPWLVSFVATAEELLQWAGIPRRNEKGLIGFQRAYNEDRVRQARDYFKIEKNQSPTSLIIGMHPRSDDSNCYAHIIFDDDENQTSNTQNIRKCKVKIEMPSELNHIDSISDKTDIAKTIASILQEQILSRNPGILNNLDEDEEIFDNEEDLDEISEDAEIEEVEIGSSLLSKLYGKLNDITWCIENIKDLADMVKPATIIDGQHRVKGAELCERNIPFSICAIDNCEWSEQVYQFTVVNYTAKGIPDQFITANAALSLTKKELGELQSRLVQAKVKVVEYDLMQIVQFDKDSPFFDMVNLTEKNDPSKIGYKTMVRIAKTWYDIRQPSLELLVEKIYPDISGKNSKKERIKKWKEEEDWGLFFKDFWNAVYDAYRNKQSHIDGHTLWDVGSSNLMIAVVLLEFQEAFFNNLNHQDEEWFEPKEQHDALNELRSKIRKRAEKFTEYFPVDFFSTVWKIKSLNTGAGRDLLKNTFRNMVDNKGDKQKYAYTRTQLFTGKTN